jgi:hypothetical protein
MRIRTFLRWPALAIAAALAACGSDSTAPSNQPPAALSAGVDLSRSGAVGTAVPGGLVVKVVDAAGRPVLGASVAFAVTQGNGATDPRVAVTDSRGNATAVWTLGTILGPNQVVATVTGVDTPIRFNATGAPGPVNKIIITPVSARLLPTVDSILLAVSSQDAFGNSTSPAPAIVIRDPSLLTLTAGGYLKALRRGAGTYVVATAGARQDSVLVTVLAVGQSLCLGAADPIDVAVGQVITDVPGSGFCVRSSTTGAEYALVSYFNSAVPSTTIPLEVKGQGLTPLTVTLSDLYPTKSVLPGLPSLIPDDAFEMRLRTRERIESAGRSAGARAWFGARRDIVGGSAASAPVVPAVGDLLKLNANALDFCDKADLRVGRVMAVTDKAIVVGDTANPAGGFTDAEYKSIGVTFDTLVDPVDRSAFGAPTDIDNNGHVILFFTRAVNELTNSGASSVVLGFFYGRDLLPRTSSTGNCAGSNVGEMFYLLVPDVDGVVNSNKRSKSLVVSLSSGTVAHEYQHLINASRRLYVNGAGGVTEEKWLDEGLSHEAEELNFFAASGRQPRTNIDGSGFSDPRFATAFATFQRNNFLRYSSYLQSTAVQAPIGFDFSDDDLQTRGAIWSFLRYAADHLPAGQENAFWFKLVNSKTYGVPNLTAALGTAPNALMRDWAISVFLDDNAPNVDARYLQPSWNMRSALPAATSVPFTLAPRALTDNVTSTLTMAGNGVSFFRFSVANGKEALLTATTGGQPLPPSMQLAVVRIK